MNYALRIQIDLPLETKCTLGTCNEASRAVRCKPRSLILLACNLSELEGAQALMLYPHEF